MNNQINISTTKGFTLIEVLVASVILFSSIAMVSMAYRSAIMSSEKAMKHVEVSSVIPFIINNIQTVIRSKGNISVQNHRGEGSSWNVNYLWKADLINFESAPELYDPEQGINIIPPKKYKLWQVELELTLESFNQTIVYNEVSWNDK